MSTPEPILETERLLLRPIGPGDAELQFRTLNTPTIMGHLGGPLTLEAIAEKHAKSSDLFAREGFSFLFVIERETGELPTLVATSARPMPRQTAWKQAARQLADDSRPWLLLLGTGWGMTDELVERCELRLPPVNGPGDYNHLSVRAAAAVILDRLRGTG